MYIILYMNYNNIIILHVPQTGLGASAVLRTDAALAPAESAGPSLSSTPLTLLDGIEHAQCGIVAGVTGRVVRVYRRKKPQVISLPGLQ